MIHVTQLSDRPSPARRALTLLALLLLLAAAARTAAAQDPPAVPDASGSELDPMTDAVQNFFNQISDSSGGAKIGLETLLRNSPFEENAKAEMIKTLAEKINGIPHQFGNYVSFEPIGIKRIGRDLVVLRYLYKCQNYPLVWYFIFYRPTSPENEGAAKSWQLIHLYYDSQLNVPLWDQSF